MFDENPNVNHRGILLAFECFICESNCEITDIRAGSGQVNREEES